MFDSFVSRKGEMQKIIVTYYPFKEEIPITFKLLYRLLDQILIEVNSIYKQRRGI